MSTPAIASLRQLQQELMKGAGDLSRLISQVIDHLEREQGAKRPSGGILQHWAELGGGTVLVPQRTKPVAMPRNVDDEPL